MFKKKALMDELVEYIKKNLKKGYTKESLKWALLNQDYSRIAVDNAFKKVDMELAAKAPVLKSKPDIKYEVVNAEEKQKKGWQFWKK